jgi:hypothetical protein
MKLIKIGVLMTILLIVIINTGISQLPQVKSRVNKNVRFTFDVVKIKSKQCIIPHLKVFADTQDIKIHKDITYGNENNPIVDCRVFIQKLVKNELVSMYVNKLSYPAELNLFEFRKFTTKDLLTDTICIEDLVPFELGQYVVKLELNYNLNGTEAIIDSDETSFFVIEKFEKNKKKSQNGIKRNSKKKTKLRYY